MIDEPFRVTQIRQTEVNRKMHRFQSAGHVLQVAFNNNVVASEKRFDGKPLRAELGRIVARTLYLPAGSELKGWSIGQAHLLRIEISPKALQAANHESGRPLTPALRPGTPLNDPFIWHLACILRFDLENGSAGGALLRDSMQMLLARHVLFATSSGSAGKLTPGAISPARLRAVREYVSTHLDREIRLAELAAVAGLSVFHFIRVFKLATGRSPYQYVLKQRLEAACGLLEATRLPIEEIAAATGFATGTGFAAAFRRRWGVSPTDYRRSAGIAIVASQTVDDAGHFNGGK